MTVPAPSVVEERLAVEQIVRRELLDARRHGYELSAETLARMQKVFESAARTIVARTAAGKMTQKRADELLDAVGYALLDIERGVVQGVMRAVTAVVTQTPKPFQTMTERLLAGQAGIAARFNRIPLRAIVALYGKRQVAAPLMTLMKRNLQGIEPEVINIIAEGMATGKDTREVAKEIQSVMLGEDAEQLALPLGSVKNLRTMLNDAKRIARTEVANALREATAQSMTETRIVQAAKWQVSGNHQVEDECDDLMNEDVGYGPGFYPPEDWPDAPHPNCACYAGDVLLRPVDQWGLEEQPKPGEKTEREKQKEQWGEPLFPERDLPPHTVVYDNVEELAEQMETKYGITIGFGDTDNTPVWAVNDQARIWEAMARAGYPMPPYMEWAYDFSFSPVTVGGYSWLMDDQIKWNLDSYVFKNREAWDRIMKYNIDSGWWSAPSTYGTYLHEPGHYLHALNMRKTFGPRSTDDAVGIPSFVWSPAAQTWMTWGQPFRDANIEKMVFEQVGEYASKAPAEMVAEVFTGLVNGKTYSKEIMDLYHQYYGPDIIPVPNLPKAMPKPKRYIKGQPLKDVLKEIEQTPRGNK